MYSKIVPRKKIIHQVRTISDEASIALHVIEAGLIGANCYSFFTTPNKEIKVLNCTAAVCSASSILLNNQHMLAMAVGITGTSFALKEKNKNNIIDKAQYLQDIKDIKSRDLEFIKQVSAQERKDVKVDIAATKTDEDLNKFNKELEKTLTLKYNRDCNFKEFQKDYTYKK